MVEMNFLESERGHALSSLQYYFGDEDMGNLNNFLSRQRYIARLEKDVCDLQNQVLFLKSNIKLMEDANKKRSLALDNKEKAVDGLRETYEKSIKELNALREELRSVIDSAKKQKAVAERDMRRQLERIRGT